MEAVERSKRLGREVKEPTPKPEKPEMVVTAKARGRTSVAPRAPPFPDAFLPRAPPAGFRPLHPTPTPHSARSSTRRSAPPLPPPPPPRPQERASLLVKAQELKANHVEEDPEVVRKREEAKILADLTARPPDTGRAHLPHFGCLLRATHAAGASRARAQAPGAYCCLVGERACSPPPPVPPLSFAGEEGPRVREGAREGHRVHQGDGHRLAAALAHPKHEQGGVRRGVRRSPRFHRRPGNCTPAPERARRGRRTPTPPSRLKSPAVPAVSAVSARSARR